MINRLVSRHINQDFGCLACNVSLYLNGNLKFVMVSKRTLLFKQNDEQCRSKIRLHVSCSLILDLHCTQKQIQLPSKGLD